ncbi:PKS-NRPS hybrid synthetase cheA-like [Mercurialis annua]|uniref:PKS-NRPS hybrid synthetase cheA-like n=1 Tax=Mercurialis annua TaxID=3986 RepID=UPI0021603EBD|nr:PKS-NRPS hybrid synthetase cheA-like [Mercurialis annua]
MAMAHAASDGPMDQLSLGDDSVHLENYGSDGIDYSEQFFYENGFESDTEAINWAKGIAIQIGFELVISSHKKGGLVKLLRCCRGERYRGLHTDLDSFARKNTKTKACQCPFRIVVKFINGTWTVLAKSGISSMHNHALAVYPEGHRQMSGLSAAAKMIVRDMSAAQAKPCAILAAVQEKFPSDNPTRRQVYNYRDNLRKSSFEDRDMVGQFFHLALTHNYLHWTLSEESTGVLTHLFMSHPDSVRLVRTYPWVIGMDSTYKTNKYHMPFFEIIGMTPSNKNFLIAYAIMKDETEGSYRWVLERLRFLIGDHLQPTCIFTDRELGLLKPVKEIFPHTPHLLCTWHINKDVEDKVFKLCGRDTAITDTFMNGSWKKLIKAQTEEQYVAALTTVKMRTRAFPAVMQYLDRTWLGHKEKFVSCWTNKVLHFGNTTTCRVESAHAQLKQWLNSSTGALDTVWTKVDCVIQSQLTDIRKTLEGSRQTIGVHRRGYPYDHVSYKVSHYCLDLVAKELRRMRELSCDVLVRCGCVLRTTHQIPCACELKAVIDAGVLISLDSIHSFWKTLVIGDGVETSEQADYAAFQSEDHRYFCGVVEEVMSQDPSIVRDISHIINERLHPEESAYLEPEVKSTVRGRPKGSTSTKRNPSVWEYSHGRGRAKSSQVHHKVGATVLLHQVNIFFIIIMQRNFIPNSELIPGIILPFVTKYVDVDGDGNCGFRVVADYIYGDQNKWGFIRRSIANELTGNPGLYDGLCSDGIQAAISRIRWEGEACGRDHWMQVIDDLFPIATLFNVAVIFINGATNSQPGFDLCDNFPVPPIASLWFTNRDATVEYLEGLYVLRRAQWQRLLDASEVPENG